MAKIHEIDMWYETFGNQEDPALLLIMGGNCQGVLWPVPFCERLAKEGFYVIRYDHRDVGFSTCFDFAENPYDLMDISKDAVGLLDFLDVKKAHLFGISMGGLVAEIMAARFPERVHSIVIMSSTSDLRPMNLALQGKAPEKGSVSSPSENYISWVEQYFKNSCEGYQNHLANRVAIWQLLSGSVAPFDKELYFALHQESLSRLKHADVQQNHFLAGPRSEDLVREVPYQIQVPTLILQGSEDPLFRPDHGEALAKAIKGSNYLLVEGMGHVPSSHFDDLLIAEIKRHAIASSCPMKSICVRVSLKEGTTETVRDWFRTLMDRRMETIESLKNEGVIVESVFLDCQPDGNFLIYYMRAKDLENAMAVFQNSSLAIDAYHKDSWSKYCGESIVLEQLLDLDTILNKK